MTSAQSTASRMNKHGGTNFDKALRPLATLNASVMAGEARPGTAIVVIDVVKLIMEGLTS